MRTSKPLLSPKLATRFALGLIASFVLASSCATSGQTQGESLALPSSFFDQERGRGKLSDACVLKDDSAKSLLPIITPAALGTMIDVAPVEAIGFFRALDTLKPSLKTVKQIRLHYWSEDAQGRPIRLSGMLYLPESREGSRMAVPIILVTHGTQVLREKVPSRLLGAERYMGLFAAATGFACVLPDYPGMGDADGFHPYCHAKSLAHASVDIVRATRAWMADDASLGAYSEGKGLYVLGYSEGGYAAMATIREMELEAKAEFALTAAYPMAGPFDMSGTMRKLMLSAEPIPNPYYLPYTIFGWYAAYGKAMDPRKALLAPYLNAILPLFDGRNLGKAINEEIARVQGVAPGQVVAAKMLTREFVDALSAPEGSGYAASIMGMLRENDLFDWPADPGSPIHLLATPSDEMVPFANSRIALEALKARGATVDLRVLKQKTHEQGGYEGYFTAMLEIWKESGALPAGWK